MQEADQRKAAGFKRYNVPLDDAPKRVNRIDFEAFSGQDMMRLSEVQITTKSLYESSRRPAPHGCLDSRLGTSQKNATCGTCGEQLATCVGHFGYIQLELPVFHVGLFKDTWTILQQICKTCSRVHATRAMYDPTLCTRPRGMQVMLDPENRALFLKKVGPPARTDAPVS